MGSSWAPLLDNELVLDPGLPYFNVGGLLLVQEEDFFFGKDVPCLPMEPFLASMALLAVRCGFLGGP